MKLLAIETSTEACSAALLLDGATLRRHEVAPRRHTELILPMLDGLLAEAGLGLRDLDGLAFGRGPGAFTGVRIATGVIQGLALATDLPVAPVSSLAAVARQMWRRHGAEQVLIAMDARMTEVYSGVYQCLDDGRIVSLDGERVCRPEILSWPPTGTQRWMGAGTGWSRYADILAPITEKLLGVVTDVYPDAIDIAHLGARMLARHQGVKAEAALPVYLRDEVVQHPAQPVA